MIHNNTKTKHQLLHSEKRVRGCVMWCIWCEPVVTSLSVVSVYERRRLCMKKWSLMIADFSSWYWKRCTWNWFSDEVSCVVPLKRSSKSWKGVISLNLKVKFNGINICVTQKSQGTRSMCRGGNESYELYSMFSVQ